MPMKVIFEKLEGPELTDPILEEAAELFSEHYGVWGKHPTSSGKSPKLGSRVRMSKSRLRAECLPDSSACSYTRVTVDGRLAGHAVACRWVYEGRLVCWVTQLVVHSDYRERGLAVGLLNLLREDDDAVYGIMSSHPAACVAAAKAFKGSITSVSTSFIRDNAEAIVRASPVPYVRDAGLQGSLFGPGDASSAVSSAFTSFFVDHAVPLEALHRVREVSDWPLGELLHGHEFLLLVEARRCSRPWPDTDRA